MTNLDKEIIETIARCTVHEKHVVEKVFMKTKSFDKSIIILDIIAKTGWSVVRVFEFIKQ
jgi:hypothetical protein